MTISEKNKRNNKIVLSIFAGILTIPYGMVFSLLTGFIATESHLLVKLLVWLLGIIICVVVVNLVFRLFKIKIVFFDRFVLYLSTLVSASLVIVISGSFEYEYFVTLLALIGICELYKKVIDSQKIKKPKR